MEQLSADRFAALQNFIEAHRASHLWFWRRDYVPHSVEELRRALQTIAKRADVPIWRQIREFESWL